MNLSWLIVVLVALAWLHYLRPEVSIVRILVGSLLRVVPAALVFVFLEQGKWGNAATPWICAIAMYILMVILVPFEPPKSKK